MSDTLTIAFVVEGPTDFLILRETVSMFLGGQDFIPKILQPEMSEAFKPVAGEHGFGWPGVCRWCLQAAEQADGPVRDNPLFAFYDILIIQIDADVAGMRYSNGHVHDPFPDITLPCEESCPPPSATTDRLRNLVVRWLGEESEPPQTVICIPSKALETWILVGLFPGDKVLKRKDNIECRKKPEKLLKGKPEEKRLVIGKENKKNVEKYKEIAPEFAEKWNRVAKRCSEAARFENDFKCVLANQS